MKNILLTGASKGLGLEICTQLLADGFRVFAVSRTKGEGLEKLAKKYASNLQFKSVDLSNAENAKSEIFSKDFLTNSTPLYGFVNNAACAYDDLVTNLNYKKLQTMFDVNVFAPMLLTKCAIRNMIFNKSAGSIVHISSISVHTGYKGLAMYAASKGALEAFSKNTAREWGAYNIRSNTVVAGFMETDMSASLTPQQREKIYARTSLKRASDTKSVAKTTIFLLSDSANSITGQAIYVDSGTI